MEKVIFDKGRIFLFIDETGDPGHPSKKDASRYYQLNILIAHRDGLRHLNKELAAFRYFRDSGKELKKYVAETKILAGIFKNLANKNGILFLSFILTKEKFMDNYLHRIGKNSDNYNPNKFRNFIVRKSLEYVFAHILSIDSERNNIEIVFDRYLESETDEEALKKYLRGNYTLPTFEKIVQIDSEYSEAVQVSDFIGRLVKDYCFDQYTDSTIDIHDFIRIFILEGSGDISEKRPDTS